MDDVALAGQTLGQFPEPGVAPVNGAMPTGEAARAARQPGPVAFSLMASSACAQPGAGPVPSGVQMP